MDPIRLQIENFCRHAKSDISFADFPSALIIGKIKGSDRFSNGVGKSTIFAAIKYVLFNEVEASTLDKVIRHGTDSCKVIFDFVSALDGETYRITRSKNKRTGSEVLLHKKIRDGWEPFTGRRNPDTEKEIAKIIKINYKTFCNSALFAQSDLSGLATLTPEKRKLALKEALQLNIYSKYEAVAKKKTVELVKEIDKEKIILKTIGDPTLDIKKFEKELDEVNSLLLAKEKLLGITKSAHDRDFENYTTLTKNFETQERESVESITKQKSLQDEINKLLETIKTYKHNLSTVGEDGKILMAEVKELSSGLSERSAVKFRDKELVKLDIENTTQAIINNKVSFNSKTVQLDTLRIPLPTGTTCNHCRQKINFSNQEERDICQKSIDADIIALETSLKLNKNDIGLLETQCTKLKEELKFMEAAEAKIIAMKAMLETKSKEIESKRTIYKDYSNLLDNNTIILTDKNKEFDLLKKSQSQYNTDQYNKLKIDIKNIKARLNTLVQELDNTNKNITALSNSKAVLSHKIEERTKDFDKIKLSTDSISKLEEKYIIHQKVIQAFGSTGIPALITHTILDDFQVETNLWLAKLRPGLQLQFTVVKDRDDGDQEDTLGIDYILDGYDMEHAMLSGAQKFIVALGLKLGLASVIKKRLGVEMRLLLIDEVDQCLDPGSLEAFEGAIRQLQQDFKVLVITHNNELKAKFNHAILVEQDENFASKAKVVNTW